MRLFAVWSQLRLRTKSLLVLSIPIIPLLMATAAIVVTAQQQRAAQRMVSHTLDVKSQVATALEITTDAEAAMTDFWLSRDPRDRARFQTAGTAWPTVSQRLLTSVSDNPVQVGHVLRARALRAERPLRTLYDYAIEQPAATSPPTELLDRSRTLLAGIRTELDQMQQVEDRLLIERGAVLRRAETRLLRVAFLSALVGLVFGVICSVSFSREISRRIDEVGDNALRLVRNEPLHVLRPSNDEIGVLGAQLEQMWGLTAERIKALDEARVELDQFFSVSLDLLCIAGTDGRFKRLNPAWKTTLGWEPEDLMARPYVDFIHPDDIPTTVSDAARQADEPTVVTIENRYRCADGSYRWLSWKSVSRPELGLIFAAARDITEQRRTNAELSARVGDLKELNNELEAFSYSVSHDLRAPLRHVTGFNSFIQRTAVDRLTDQERRWLSQSIEAAQRMGRLIDDLLAFSRMGRAPLARERVKLDDVVREARHEVSGAAIDARHIAWSIAPLPEVQGDASMLRSVFINLIDNAVKYTQPCSHATIEVGVMPQSDAHAVIFVRDNGVGFDMQYVHKLFGVFQRLHSSEDFAGTGIGLANVRRIVLRHGGQAWAESKVGAGATFFVSLPLFSGGLAA